MKNHKNFHWPRADVLALIGVIAGLLGVLVGVLVAVTTPEIRCKLGLSSETCPEGGAPDRLPVSQISRVTTSPESKLPTLIEVRVGGSTSMARMTRYLSERASSYSTNMSISYFQKGSDEGMKELRNGKVDVAALSRELTDSEKQEGLIAVYIAEDPIAVVVGKYNPIEDLSDEQVEQIFRCEVTDWSQVGGKLGFIKAINRGHASGTRVSFQKQALKEKEFCGDIETWRVDETIPILRQLGSNGVTFATYSDVAEQSIANVVKINGLMPNASNYPYHHPLYFVYKSDNQAGAEFLKYINSPEGRRAIEDWNKIRSGGN
jgi:phosphate transport system substrate-binding protein